MTQLRKLELELDCKNMISRYRIINPNVNGVSESMEEVDNRTNELTRLYCKISHIGCVALDVTMERMDELDYMKLYLKSIL